MRPVQRDLVLDGSVQLDERRVVHGQTVFFLLVELALDHVGGLGVAGVDEIAVQVELLALGHQAQQFVGPAVGLAQVLVDARFQKAGVQAAVPVQQ